MMSLTSLPHHELWPDVISIFDAPIVDCERLLRSSQITETYLLALVSARGGVLATFDRRLITDTVLGGRKTYT